MKSKKDIDIIIELMSKWHSKIVLNNALSYYDINRVSENLALNILNLCYNLELDNLNTKSANYAGIDLGDSTKSKIAFQVTSRLDSNKIMDTLRIFVDPKHNLLNTYTSGIRFFILSYDKPTIPKKERIDNVYSEFDSDNHIINFSDLIRRISALQKSNPLSFDKLKDLLEREFEGPYEQRMSNFFILNSSLKEELDLKEVTDKIEKEFLPKYLIKEYENFREVKTFLFPNPRPFKEVYYPVTLKTYDSYKRDGLDIFETSNKITIFGNAGTGKSTFLNKIFLQCIDEYFAIPVLIELRKLNSFDGTLLEYITFKLFQNKFKSTDPIISSFLENGSILFLLDGFDELFYEKSMDRIYEIDDFAKFYYKNFFVITSRPGTNVVGLTNFQNLDIQPFEKEQIIEFIDRNVKLEELKSRILFTINEERNIDLLDYLSNPLLLSMFIKNYEYHPEIPNLKSRFYFNLFDTLYQRHGGENKLGFIHKKETGFTREDFEVILQYFSFITYFEGHIIFNPQYIYEVFEKIKKSSAYKFENRKLLNDLHIALNILIIDGNEFTFPHRSLQEYFTVLCIKNFSNKSVKENIYKNKFEILFSNSKDSLLNLFSLCIELDKANFYEHFLIPKLNKLISKLGEIIKSKILIVQFLNLYFEITVNRTGQLSIFPNIRIKHSINQIYSLIGIDFSIHKMVEQCIDSNILEQFAMQKVIGKNKLKIGNYKGAKHNGIEVNEIYPNTILKGKQRNNYNIYYESLLVSLDPTILKTNPEFLIIIEKSDLDLIIEKILEFAKKKVFDLRNELDSDKKHDENLSLFIN